MDMTKFVIVEKDGRLFIINAYTSSAALNEYFIQRGGLENAKCMYYYTEKEEMVYLFGKDMSTEQEELATADMSMSMSSGIEAIFSNVKSFIKGSKDNLSYGQWIDRARFYDTQLFTISMLLKPNAYGNEICKILRHELEKRKNEKMNEHFGMSI